MYWVLALTWAASLANLTSALSIVNTRCATQLAPIRAASIPTRYLGSKTTTTVLAHVKRTSTLQRAAPRATTTVFTTVTRRTTVTGPRRRVTRTTTRTANTYLPAARTTITATSTSLIHTSSGDALLIPTSAGFRGVLDTLPDAAFADPPPFGPMIAVRAKERLARAPSQFPVGVICTRATTFYKTKTRLVTDVAIIQQRAVTKTVTKTRTSLRTIHSPGPVTRVTSTIITTSTHRLTKTFTDLKTTTITTTTRFHSTTIYAACTAAASNKANYVNIQGTSYTFGNAPTRNSSLIFEDGAPPSDGSTLNNAFDCCNFCLAEPSCAFVSWVPLLNGSPGCVRLRVQPDADATCQMPGQYSGGTATQGDVHIQLSQDGQGDQYQVMNGNCGQFTAVDPPKPTIP